MILAIDFDDTYTAHPEFWQAVCCAALRYGIKPVIVSCRERSEENIDLIREATGLTRGSIYLTSSVAKRWYMEQLGIKVDWWCDDFPESIANAI